ncbi:MAG: hemolysin III family protein [Oscillospiraceae bacterium]
MIYVLIAGTIRRCFSFAEGTKGAVFTAAMCVALIGTLLKVFWMGMPRVLSTVLYILMGWAILIDIPRLPAWEPAALCCWCWAA